jgi:7-cyano-7-deazaguanine synthase
MKVVVLLSGGLDSTVLAADLHKRGERLEAITFNYGQRHARELDAARAVAASLNIPQNIVDLDLARLAPTSSQTSSSIAVPHGHYADESMRVTVVPNRNMVMLSLAIARAIADGADAVAFAAHKGDHAIYPDCRLPFVRAMEKVAAVCHYDPIQILTPFLNSSKTDIVRRGALVRAPFALTYSCYEGGPQHCGECGTCVERREAFARARVLDPTTYAEVTA